VGLRFRAPLGSDANPALLGAIERHATTRDRATCLPFPCRNAWLLEEIAVWLTLGRIAGLAHDVLHRSDSTQNGECLAWRGNPPVVAHYFSGLETRFFAKVPPL
jgi:hypothetical protein